MPLLNPSDPAFAARLLPMLDLTSLGEDDGPTRIEALCAQARKALPAAVCVYPEHVTTVRRAMQGTPVKVATVVNFPDGSADTARVQRETRRAIAAGADEIDLVLPYRAFCRGETDLARAVVDVARQACGSTALLKLILETGELATPERIGFAARLGLDAGVDFLKTSTGKVAVNATPEAAAIMLEAIAERGGRCGFKAAGGIRSLMDAAVYFDLARTRLGDAWVTPVNFRIGASALHAQLAAMTTVPTT